MSLITGALPAQYGLRTSGVLDIETRSDAFNNSGMRWCLRRKPGKGSRRALNMAVRSDRPSISSPAATCRTTSASRTRPRIGRNTRPHRAGARLWLRLDGVDPYTRFSLITGASVSKFQIPNNPGQMPEFHRVRGLRFRFRATQRKPDRTQYGCGRAAALGERRGRAGVVFHALQQRALRPRMPRRPRVQRRRVRRVPQRVCQRHHRRWLVPAQRRAYPARRIPVSTEKTQVTNSNTLLPLDDSDSPVDAPFTAVDSSRRLDISRRYTSRTSGGSPTR